MSKRAKSIRSNCSSVDCPVFQNEQLRKIYCGNRGLCEKLENYDSRRSDREILFRYEP